LNCSRDSDELFSRGSSAGGKGVLCSSLSRAASSPLFSCRSSIDSGFAFALQQENISPRSYVRQRKPSIRWKRICTEDLTSLKS